MQVLDEFNYGLERGNFDQYYLYKAYTCFSKIISAGIALADSIVASWV